MRRELETGLSGDVPIVLSQWYDTTKWILEKIDNFPKSQRFIFGTRLAVTRCWPGTTGGMRQRSLKDHIVAAEDVPVSYT